MSDKKEPLIIQTTIEDFWVSNVNADTKTLDVCVTINFVDYKMRCSFEFFPYLYVEGLEFKLYIDDDDSITKAEIVTNEVDKWELWRELHNCFDSNTYKQKIIKMCEEVIPDTIYIHSINEFERCIGMCTLVVSLNKFNSKKYIMPCTIHFYESIKDVIGDYNFYVLIYKDIIISCEVKRKDIIGA